MPNYEIFFLQDIPIAAEAEPEYQIFFPANDLECNKAEIIYVQLCRASTAPETFIKDNGPLVDEIIATAFGFFSFLVTRNNSIPNLVQFTQ